MTMNPCPSCSAMSWITQTFGWMTAEAVRASWRKRALSRKELQSDEAIKSCVVGLIDNTHTPLAQLFNDLVVRDCLADQRSLLYHGSFVSTFGGALTRFGWEEIDATKVREIDAKGNYRGLAECNFGWLEHAQPEASSLASHFWKWVLGYIQCACRANRQLAISATCGCAYGTDNRQCPGNNDVPEFAQK